MKVLAFDPGAKRMGWSCLEGTRSEAKENKPPIDHGSGIFGLDRGGNESSPEPFQKYRLRLIDFWIQTAPKLIDAYRPDIIVGEIVPAIGGGGFRSGSTQSQLAETAITVVFVVARQNAVDVAQVGATSIKARIGGSKKATKVGVRNGVLRFCPSAKRFEAEWKKTQIHEMSDAFGVGLTYLGYDGRKNGRK